MSSIKQGLIKKISSCLSCFFSTDQNYFAEQQLDGTYKKTQGLIHPGSIEKILKEKRSVAVYQKNIDSTIRWICYDYDILKEHLKESTLDKAEKVLVKYVKDFCKRLDELEISYLLEDSGNRGFHVWLTFENIINYETGYEILKAIESEVNLSFDQEYLGLDLFPKLNAPSDGVGSALKLPLSLHKKSGCYSFLINNDDLDGVSGLTSIKTLSDEIIQSQITILENHESIKVSALEKKLGVFFDLAHDENISQHRIRRIQINKNGFTIDELFKHWKIKNNPLVHISNRLLSDKTLNNEERKLFVGLLNNIESKFDNDFSITTLLNIFSKTKNYNKEKTNVAIKALSSFYFPSQQQIEEVTKQRFEEKLSIDELIKSCIPNVIRWEDATFEVSSKDMDIVRRAELNYVLQNDEAQSKIIINELSNEDNSYQLIKINTLNNNQDTISFYIHLRNEGTDKVRTLISLGTTERLLTSFIFKQLIYFLDISPNNNSYGYRPNKGFSNGYIFKPWLYLWINFLSNISSAIEDVNNQNRYIVKTDISKFYDKVPHDNLKRLLLGGVNHRIDKKLNQFSESLKSQYKVCVDTLFNITNKVVGKNRGLPQGPAYARFLAELYLDNIDQKFSKKITNGEVFLYQRYVDDIFFIAHSEDKARAIFQELKQDLEQLGLSINQDKTNITRIKSFSNDFDNYRSQSKYAVDSVSQNFEDATDTQKDMALNEFMKLVQSDSCNDDLAFIFSHLAGVEQLDEIKKEMVLPILAEKNGRGSLYKHLFNFILEDSNNWSLLDNVSKFNELQSEVLTSSIINKLETTELEQEKTDNLILLIEGKLSETVFVKENLAYLYLKFSTKVSIESLPPELIIKSLISVKNTHHLNITSILITHINTELNNIKKLPTFIDAIYPLCSCLSTEKLILNDLAQTFYAKFIDIQDGDKATSSIEISIFTTEKYYYLLCLFSLSIANSSVETLKQMWSQCIDLYNDKDIDLNSSSTPNWLSKVGDIDVDSNKENVIITSVIDGSICRGAIDKRKIFERFHSLVLIFITMKSSLLDSQNISDALELIKDKATFYKWLVERDNVTYFPENNRAWFEKNIIENSTIQLKRHNQVLIRRPTNEFISTSVVGNEHHGYSELLVDYNRENLLSIQDVIADLSIKEQIDFLLEIIKNSKSSGGSFPNIYCNEKVLNKEPLSVFNEEMSNSKYLIFQPYGDNDSDSYDNNLNNFIVCFFRQISEGKNADEHKRINEKYIKNLDNNIDLFEFIQNTSNQLSEIKDIEDSFFYDVALSSALYLSIKSPYFSQKIEDFVNQYHKFNRDDIDRHVYCVNKSQKIEDENPLQLLKTIEESLGLLTTKVIPSLAFYLDKDIEDYKKALCSLSEMDEYKIDPVNLEQFSKANHKISLIKNTININGMDYEFQNAYLLSPANMTVQTLESKNSTLINSSEHIYFLEKGNTLFIVAIHSSISKIFISIKKRFECVLPQGLLTSYPPLLIKKQDVHALRLFDDAVENISTHRDVTSDEARSILTKWLLKLPSIFHQSSISLIAAHVVMSSDDRNLFLDKVQECLNDKSKNPFLIKRPEDHNGTYRLLYTKSSLGRKISQFDPKEISRGAHEATLITDVVISGSQVSKAIQFYVSQKKLSSFSNLENDNKSLLSKFKKLALSLFKNNLNKSPKKQTINKSRNKNQRSYFVHTNEEIQSLIKNLKSLRKLNICTILYTDEGIKKIESKAREFLNSKIKISVVSGRLIRNEATFEKTENISEIDKRLILDLLNNKEEVKNLYSHLDCKIKPPNMDESYINERNLIARYQSLPKRCFSFLHTGVKYDPSCHPLNRIKENGE